MGCGDDLAAGVMASGQALSLPGHRSGAATRFCPSATLRAQLDRLVVLSGLDTVGGGSRRRRDGADH
ncbi:MAG: hypothetical protein ACRDTD_28220 [Pseudonocardiaceae bacterium]